MPRCAIRTRAAPLVVFGPTDDAHAEIGADGVWRYSAYQVMVICPTHFNLGLYLCNIDVLSGALRGEGTRGVPLRRRCRDLDVHGGGGQPPHLVRREDEFHFARTVRRELQIVASSGDCPTIPVVIPGEGESPRAQARWSEIEDVIAAVRRVLRDRKNAAARLEQV